jgi:hypothetical protein
MAKVTGLLLRVSACIPLWFGGTGLAETVVRADEEPVVLHLLAVDDGSPAPSTAARWPPRAAARAWSSATSRRT